MIYFQAKNDLEFMEHFKANVKEFWNTKVMPYKLEENEEVRRQVAEEIIPAIQIAKRSGVQVDFIEYPDLLLASSAPQAPYNLFQVILTPTNYRCIDEQEIEDAINQTLGQCRERVSREFQQLINPFYWLKIILTAIIRLPFTLSKLSGFNVAKIEEHLWARVVHLFYLIALVILGTWLGVQLI